ncbi:YheO-like PAS domain-containing protein [Dendrosporobacter quercicolus]|uniref:YheO-like PAS domain-containing protein n=1 Tax=Dendrosporobacter quercicolus TaxID=146817 RepID=A0A1G9YG22_9FIRM|nr:PAS domain-containing protein [Dendrosporobacter quercicolus]SDN07433.1 YheO-like PAS domain-containing protein [Dendrosporobacter quercicolus]
MFKPSTLNLLAQLARGIARQFGNNCEIVVHDLSRRSIDNSIVIIENGHVTSRKAGDGPSHEVLEALKENPPDWMTI